MSSIVLNFKALLRFADFRDEPLISSLVLKLLNGSKDKILKCKHNSHIEHVVEATARLATDENAWGE